MKSYDPSMFSLDINDPEDLELIEMFLSALPERVETLISAAHSNDLETLRTISHQLKGAAPGFGCDPIGQAAADLEAQLKALDIDSCTVDSIRDELEDLIDQCNTYIRAA